MPRSTKDPLDVWAHAGSREIDLPSGVGKAKIRTLDIIDGVAFGSIPNPLRGIALKAEAGEFNPEDATDEELQEWSNLKAQVVASVVEEFAGKPVDLTPDWVRDHMPKEDRDRIFAQATHILLPKQLQGLAMLSSFREGLGSLLTAQDSDGDGKGTE